VLLWIGPEAEAPACPESAPAPVYKGYDGLETEQSCPPCACDPAACLPPGLVASDAACPGSQPGSTQVPVAAPEGWEDGCFATPEIADGDLASVVLQPPELGPCMPITGAIPAKSSVSWARVAIGCMSAESPAGCEDISQQCAPVAEGFRQCVFMDGDSVDGQATECPAGYPERQVFYRGVESNLGCTECTCGPPEGGACAVHVTLHKDEACAQDLTSGSVALGQMTCVDVGAPGDLRAFSASLEVDMPGACTPAGGEPIGEAKPAGPATFCCRQ
jgi:hypothetical protein